MSLDNKFHIISQKHIEKQIERYSHIRCQMCWLDKMNCICNQIPSITFHRNINFIIYLDYLEFMNPGDDAKLLTCSQRHNSPSNCFSIIYPIENNKLLQLSCLKESKIIVLFPCDNAISYEEYSSSQYYEDINIFPITIIVIDAVWRHARKMAKKLFQLLNDNHIQYQCIKLTPLQLSIYARQQTQPDRISSIEALALMLQCFGEDLSSCQQLIDCLKLNNNALKRKPMFKSLS